MTRVEVMAMYAVPRWRLALGTALSALLGPLLIIGFWTLSTGTWELISGRPVEAPTIAFMSNYSKPAQNSYWLFVLATVIVMGVMAGIPSRLGGGLGKRLVGVVYLTEFGYPTEFGSIAAKGAIYIAYFLILALPGPLLGFSFGDTADPVSMASLIAGLGLVGYLLWRRDASGRAQAYRHAGIVPVRITDRDTCAAALRAADA